MKNIFPIALVYSTTYPRFHLYVVAQALLEHKRRRADLIAARHIMRKTLNVPLVAPSKRWSIFLQLLQSGRYGSRGKL